MNDWNELIKRLDKYGVDAQIATEFIYEFLVRRLEDDPEHDYADDDDKILDEIKTFVWKGVWE